MFRVSLFILFLISFFFPFSDTRAGSPPYALTLVDEANHKVLHSEKYWHTLLHYKSGIFGLRSLIDDPNFFLAPDGKHNPQAELEATIRAFFQEPREGTKHPVCRFVARYHWLKGQLNIDPSQLPMPECSHFEQLMEEIKPETVALIFPTSHINSPASMFGHTLLTIETATRSKLLSHAINYSAITTDTFGPLFAVKGLFGFYKGYFSILPYYGKLQEYNDIDHRDIWEYPLNFNKEETLRLLMHVYELDSIYSDYYFFDENCSYNLLFLLDVGRPSLNIADQMDLWVIPIDTIKVVKKNGLINETIYRPSKTTKVHYIASLLLKKDHVLALAMAKGEMEPDDVLAQAISQEEKAITCDLAIEYLQYLYTKKRIEKQRYLDRFLKLLKTRSTLGQTGENHFDIPHSPRPDEGHDSNRLSLGAGIKKDRFFYELRYRPAYHSLLDNGKGYPDGSQIVFGDTVFRYYPSLNRLKLEALDFIDIISITPRDPFFKPISWKIKTGLTQRYMEDGREHMVYQLNPGGGFAYRHQPMGIWYAMAETDLNLGGAMKEKYALGAGASIGLITKASDVLKIHLSARNIYYGIGDYHNYFEALLQANLTLTTNTSMAFQISRTKTRAFYQTEGALAWNIYF